MSVNHNRKPYWVGIIKRGPVIWASSTGLYVLTIKSLVSTQKDYLDRKGLYLKSVTLLAILMLEKKKNVSSKLFCILHWLSSWNVFDQLQSLKPMSLRLKRLKWSMIFSDSYCLRICFLPLDFFHYQTYDKLLTVFHVYV